MREDNELKHELYKLHVLIFKSLMRTIQHRQTLTTHETLSHLNVKMNIRQEKTGTVKHSEKKCMGLRNQS